MDKPFGALMDSDRNATLDVLKRRINILSERAWESRITWDLVTRWLENFDGRGSSL